MQFPQVIASSVIRSAHQGQSHGGVYIVDLQTEQWRQVIDWNDPSINWDGRGNDRGLRGIALHGGKVYLAASDELFVYGPGFKIVRSFRNRYLKYCHEICLYDRYIYLTSTRFDSVLEFDIKKRAFTRGWCFRPLDPRNAPKEPCLVPFDPNSPDGPIIKDSYHINNVFADETGLYVAGTMLESIFEISRNELKPFARLPRGSHNARPFKSGVLMNDTLGNRVVYQDRDGRILESFSVELYPKADLLMADLPADHARQGFGRGLAVWNEDFVITGSSPATLSVYQLGTSRRIKRINLTKDVRNSIHGLALWPSDYHSLVDPSVWARCLGFANIFRSRRSSRN
jgi:hypothetical protein